MTRAPIPLPTWIAALPTPPAAPWTSSVSPSVRRPRRSSAKWAVWWFIRKPAACSKLRPSGIGKQVAAGALSTSAKPPVIVIAIARSPGSKPEPSGAQRIVPAHSTPE